MYDSTTRFVVKNKSRLIIISELNWKMKIEINCKLLIVSLHARIIISFFFSPLISFCFLYGRLSHARVGCPYLLHTSSCWSIHFFWCFRKAENAPAQSETVTHSHTIRHFDMIFQEFCAIHLRRNDSVSFGYSNDPVRAIEKQSWLL